MLRSSEIKPLVRTICQIVSDNLFLLNFRGAVESQRNVHNLFSSYIHIYVRGEYYAIYEEPYIAIILILIMLIASARCESLSRTGVLHSTLFVPAGMRVSP